MSVNLTVHSLHALAYCERLFYLENAENLRVADERVYAGRRLHVEIERNEDEGEWLTLQLETEGRIRYHADNKTVRFSSDAARR